jgi:hypothetical protein
MVQQSRDSMGSCTGGTKASRQRGAQTGAGGCGAVAINVTKQRAERWGPWECQAPTVTGLPTAWIRSPQQPRAQQDAALDSPDLMAGTRPNPGSTGIHARCPLG